MKRTLRIGFLAAAMFTAAAGHASAQGGVALGLKIGTLGPGLELSAYLNDKLNLRVAGQYFTLGVNGVESDISYDADLRMSSVLALADFHPFENNFRISAGVAFNNNELQVDGTASEPETIGDNEYTPEQIGRVTGRATFDEIAPYVGLGYGNAVHDRYENTISFSFDIGVVFQGTPDVELRSTGALASDPGFQADLKEEEEEIQEDADFFKIYPVISFGVAYYFW